MKGVVIAMGRLSGRPAAARMIDGRLDDLFVDPPADAPPAPGAIFRAVLGRPVKGMGGAFVDLPEGRHGFLRQPKGLAPGRPVLVQVSGHAEPGKAVPVTTRLLLKSRYAILTPGAPGHNLARDLRAGDGAAALRDLAARAMSDAPDDLGLILRSACATASANDIADDIAALRALTGGILNALEGGPECLLDAPDARGLAWRDWALPVSDLVDDSPAAFSDHGVDEAVAALLRPQVALPGGGTMAIEPTRALIAIDVNTGPDTSPAAGLKANIAAARALPRELRLRGLGGQAVVDFAPMPKKDRQALDQAFQAAVKRDGGAETLAGWTPLGNFELTRRRDRLPLTDLLGGTD